MTGNCTMLDPDCFEYYPHFLDQAEADRYLQSLWQGLCWSQQEIRMFGRRVMQPRLIAWYGDPSAGYTYSGLKLEPMAWHPDLLELKNRIEESAGHGFNSVLANAYRDGRDSMGWHRDNEPELGERPFIASLSLGATRRFLIRPVVASEAEAPRSTGLALGHGSLLIMKGLSQQKYKHSLPKTRRINDLRLNLTFRAIRA